MGNKSDMCSWGHIIQPAVLTCQKRSHLNEDLIQYYKTVRIVEPVRRGRERRKSRGNTVAVRADRLHLCLKHLTAENLVASRIEIGYKYADIDRNA